ncbi:MAG: NAD(P)H-dependent flavin oxidoreductase [Syntrophomonadaceae bacterium]|jgi:nitronate monooxygenase
MKLPQLRIGHLLPKFPIIQGGMAVRVSTATLAGAVAKTGGIGVIGATGMSLEELRDEIRQARILANGGIVGVNIMYAARQFADLVHAAISEKIDVIFSGAGFSKDIFRWGKEANTPIVSIVSSAKAARLAEKCGADAVVAESGEAGGHLGTLKTLKEILPEIVKAVKIPVIAAGGLVNGYDMAEAIKMGASGVQMASRFVLSEECTVSPAFKQTYLNSQADDSIIIKSPVGFPGRALKNPFSNLIQQGEAPEVDSCNACLKECSGDFCIMQALINAREGRVNEGLVFAGINAHKIKEILPVSEIFQRILKEFAEAD